MVDVVHLHWPCVTDPIDRGGDSLPRLFKVVVEQVWRILMLSMGGDGC